MGGNEKHAWAAGSRKLEERKISSHYPATKVRKVSTWQSSKIASPPKQKLTVSANSESRSSCLLQRPSEELPQITQSGSGAYLKAPLRECTAKRGPFDKPLWPAHNRISNPATPAFKAQVPRRGGGASMSGAFGSQILVDEAVGHVEPKAGK